MQPHILSPLKRGLYPHQLPPSYQRLHALQRGARKTEEKGGGKGRTEYSVKSGQEGHSSAFPRGFLLFIEAHEKRENYSISRLRARPCYVHALPAKFKALISQLQKLIII